MLNDILILDQQWLPNQSDFPPISYRAWPLPIMSGFHGAFATGVACQQGTLTLPDTWFRPSFWDLLMLQLLRPNSSNLPCLYSTFHLEYPLVLSRFWLVFGMANASVKVLQKHATVTTQPIRLSTNSMTLIPSLTFTELWVVAMEYLQRMWLAVRECLPFRTPGSVPIFGLACALIIETSLPCLYSTFHLEYPLVLSRCCITQYTWFTAVEWIEMMFLYEDVYHTSKSNIFPVFH